MKPQPVAPVSHTPGPWFVDDCGMIYDARDCIIAQAFDNPDTGMEPLDSEPSTFNARLIAATPDLLEVLKGLLGRSESATMHDPKCPKWERAVASCGCGLDALHAQARAAIARAQPN